MRIVALASLALLAACGPGENDPIVIADTPLAGTVGGIAWSPTAAMTNPSASDNLVFSARFVTGLVEDPCASTDFTPPLVLTRLPTTPGEYLIDTTNTTLTFTLPAVGNGNITNRQAAEGAIRIDSVDTTINVLTGALRAHFDDDNTVEGTFSVTICAPVEEEEPQL
jgi:hypothetical protein